MAARTKLANSAQRIVNAASRQATLSSFAAAPAQLNFQVRQVANQFVQNMTPWVQQTTKQLENMVPQFQKTVHQQLQQKAQQLSTYLPEHLIKVVAPKFGNTTKQMAAKARMQLKANNPQRSHRQR